MESPSSGAVSNIMLAILEKKTANSVDFYWPLRKFVVITHSESMAQNLEDDLQRLRQLRSDVEKGVAFGSLTTRRDLLQSYYKALCAIECRFPISKEKDHVNTVTFSWFDAFKKKRKASQQNIHLEKAAVLFNLGAIHSQIGLGFYRSDADERKQASHSFSAAAGAFAFLRVNESMKASVGSSTTLDVSVACAGMLERLMLAQAQECVYENTIAKGSSAGVCAKISRQVGAFYEEAFAALNVFPLNQHFDKAWIAHTQLKAALYYAEACYRYSLELHEKEEIAEEIVRLQSGVSALFEAKKSSPKGASQQLLDTINKLGADLNNNLDRAKKENDKVYLMKIPPASSLSSLPSFSMVKPIPLEEVLDASRDKMFASLVPDSSAKALSKYTEMVDEIIRTQAERLQQGSELARVRLKEMYLPDSIFALEGNISLPTALKEAVEAVQICGGPAGFAGELLQLKDLRRVNQELLTQTEDQLQKEVTEDSQFRNQFGTQWTRPQSSTLTTTIQDRLNRFASHLKQAAESDAQIERSIREHSAVVSILDCCPIESAMSSLTRPIISLDANEDTVVGSLKQSLRQLETLGTQRAGLEDMLKEMKRKDDILPKLMISTASHEDLFRKEISKYDHICEEIAENLKAQEKLLILIQDQNEEFVAVFKLEDYKASQGKSYEQIEAAVSKFQEIKENIKEGLKFYVTLQDAITNIKQQCSDFVTTRSVQCREMTESLQRQMSGLSLQDSTSTAGYSYSSNGQPLRANPQQQPDPGNIPASTNLQTSADQLPRHPMMPTYAQPPYGTPPHQQPPYGTPQHQQPPYGTLPHQQPPYGTSQHQQPAYGTSQHQQPAYGAPQYLPPPYGILQHQPPPYGTPQHLPPPYPPQHQPPPYGTPQHQPPYPAPATSTPHPAPQYQQPAISHEYGQPAYPGWQGPYHSGPPPQTGSLHQPPYAISSPYPSSHYNGHYR